MPAYETFALGGPLRLSGFRLNQFSGREYVFGRVMYYNRILPLPEILGKGVFAGASAEVGNIRNRADGLPSPGTQSRDRCSSARIPRPARDISASDSATTAPSACTCCSVRRSVHDR